MRIIKRKNMLGEGVVYVVQDEAWNGAAAYQNSLLPQRVFGKSFQDIRHFLTLAEAKAFAHQYVNNLQPGEEIVG